MVNPLINHFCKDTTYIPHVVGLWLKYRMGDVSFVFSL